MFRKNKNLIPSICQVRLKSAHGSLFPDLQEIYSTLSKINFRSDSRITRSGIQYENRLTLSFPGLSKAQFNLLDRLANGLYEVQFQTDTGHHFQVADFHNPMAAEIFFMLGTTEIIFEHTAVEEIKSLGSDPVLPDQDFPYTLTLSL